MVSDLGIFLSPVSPECPFFFSRNQRWIEKLVIHQTRRHLLISVLSSNQPGEGLILFFVLLDSIGFYADDDDNNNLYFPLTHFLWKLGKNGVRNIKHDTLSLYLSAKGFVLLAKEWNWKFSFRDVVLCWRRRNLSSTTTMIRVESARFTGLLSCQSYSEIFSFSRRFFVIDDNQSLSLLMMNEVWAMLVDLLLHVGQVLSIIIDPAGHSWIYEGGFFLSLFLFLPSGFLPWRYWEKTKRINVNLAQDASLIHKIERLVGVYPEKNKRREREKDVQREHHCPLPPNIFSTSFFWFTQPDVMVNEREGENVREK